MESMMIAPGVYVEFRKIGKDVEIIRVYRKNAIGFNGDYTFTDPAAVEWAKAEIRLAKRG